MYGDSQRKKFAAADEFICRNRVLHGFDFFDFVRVFVTGDELVDHHGNGDAAEKCGDPQQGTGAFAEYFREFQLRPRQQFHQRYIDHNSAGKSQRAGKKTRIGTLGKKSYAAADTRGKPGSGSQQKTGKNLCCGYFHKKTPGVIKGKTSASAARSRSKGPYL